jgi:hypothetical protein
MRVLSCCDAKIMSTRAATSQFKRGQWMQVQVKFKMQGHIKSGVVMDVAAFKVSHSVDKDAAALRASRARSKSIGTMDEMSQKVRNANTHLLRRQNHEDAHSNRSVKGSVQGSDG